METAVRTEKFRVHTKDLEDFKVLLHSVLPEEAEVSSFSMGVTDVQVTVPSRAQRVFRKIRKCGFLL